MEINVRKARENNLKDFSVDIPVNKVTAITGVSGSGKSTLLKNVLGATGARRLTAIKSKTVRSALSGSNIVKAESVANLPTTILIDAKSSISNSNSTVSTISGVHDILRNLFEDAGECHCPHCHSKIEKIDTLSGKFVVDVVCDEQYNLVVDSIKQHGRIICESFFDKNRHLLSKRNRSAIYAEIHFYLQTVKSRWVQDFNKTFLCTIMSEGNILYNPLTLVQCKKCGSIVPCLSRSRLSFNTPFEDGGGMCRSCHGSGVTSCADVSDFIVNEKKAMMEGGIRFVSEKGLQFTTLNASLLKAAARMCEIDFKAKVKDIPRANLTKLMFGTNSPVVVNIGGGKKKEISFKGIIGTLQESFLKGKGKSALSKYFEIGTCSACHGLRTDPEISGLTLWGKPLSEFISMTFDDLRNWCKETLPKIDQCERVYVERLLKKVDAFCQVSCGHLSLDRRSNTLSGGEMQRIRVCALLTANVNGVCYLLDEPSSGLHEQDIGPLGLMLREMCNRGNTVIIVEHNKQLLNYCDWIIDVGPKGGTAGGTLLFSESFEKAKKHDTQTSKLLTDKWKISCPTGKAKTIWSKFLTFKNLSVKNLKNVNVSLPYGGFTTICGISGSGKSTLLRDVIYAQIATRPSEFGFNDVVYIAQQSFSVSGSSTVATQLDCFSMIIKLFSKATKFPIEQFLPNSKGGKCHACAGHGAIYSDANEFIGVCSECSGLRYAQNILNGILSGTTFMEVIKCPLAELGDLLSIDELKSFSKTADLLGIGYLTLSRRTNTLSKGEFQRLRIANAIYQNVRDTLFLLDEPSRGLHASDACSLVDAIHHLTKLGNTVVAVEHNPGVIGNSDYIIEFGGTGKTGGYLLYDGTAFDIQKINTPTSQALAGNILPQKTKVEKATTAVVYKSGDKVHDFRNNEIHYLEAPTSNEIINLSAVTTSDFLSVAIPGNTFYSRAYRFSETIKSAPIIHHVNFKEKCKFDYSLYDFLGLKDQFIASAMVRCAANSELLRYVFDDSSPTGKCHFCRGRGITFTVPEGLFINDGVLTKKCRAFLRKGANIIETLKALKRNAGIDILASDEKMDLETQKIFLYGAQDILDGDGQPILWTGMVNYFLRNHAYYPDKNAEDAFSKKTLSTCPVCLGKMLSPNFLKYSDMLGVSYHDVLSRPFSWVFKHLDSGCDTHLGHFKSIIEDVLNFGFEMHCARERMQELSEIESGLATLVALKNYGFTQCGIVLSGLNLIPSAMRKAADKILQELQRANTIFIC